MSTPALKAVIAHAIFNDGNGVPVLRLGVEAYKVTTPAGVFVAADGGNVEWAVSGVPAVGVTGGGNGRVGAHVGYTSSLHTGHTAAPVPAEALLSLSNSGGQWNAHLTVKNEAG